MKVTDTEAAEKTSSAAVARQDRLSAAVTSDSTITVKDLEKAMSDAADHTYADFQDENSVLRSSAHSDSAAELTDFSGTATGKRQTYHDQVDIQNTLALREVLASMPKFAKMYFRAVEPTTSTRTRLSYAYDIRTFFRYLQDANPVFNQKPVPEWTVDMLDLLEATDIEEYQEFLKVYDIDNRMTGVKREVSQVTNGERGLKRKMSALRSFYAYFYKRQMINRNPTVLVDMPKLHEKAIIRLDDGETAALLDYIEHGGDHLTGQRKLYYEKTKTRDLAIVTLLLGTGIRVSECVGLDLQDVDFRNDGIRVVRKGGSEMIVYFGNEVRSALINYIQERQGITPVAGHENALFYSTQRKRIGVKAVENLVKKYAASVTTTKKITPHKLRSTYGTALYRETGDIYLVADVLGHKDVNTTKKHYAAMDDDRRRRAAGAVHLREEG